MNYDKYANWIEIEPVKLVIPLWGHIKNLYQQISCLTLSSWSDVEEEI